MFKRLGNLIRGFFGLFVSGLEKKNPEALLEVEKENLRTQIIKYNEGLASHAALAERLMTQVNKQEALAERLRARTSVLLKAGKQAQAAETALSLKRLSGELATNREQVAAAEQTYQDLVRARDVSIKTAKERLRALAANIEEMRIEKATAELTEMASGMVTELGGAGDTLNRLEEMVEEERSRAKGRSRVAQEGLDLFEVDVAEAEHQALAEQALADFAASEGITLEGDTSSTTEAGKSMGRESE